MNCIRGRDPHTLTALELHVEGGVLVDVRKIADDPGDVWIAPGLVDLQVNGYRGIDLNGDTPTTSDVLRLTRMLRAEGTTTYLPTIITAPPDAMRSRVQAIVRARRESDEVEHAVPMIHLEGPHLSPIDGYRGAHPLHAIRPPSLEEFDLLQAAAEGLIGLVTLSPHWPGAASFIAALRVRGVLVAIGHTHASPEEITQAVDAGAQLSTHLGNGIAAELPRHPNPLWTQLADDRLHASVIADGLHLPAEVLRVVLRSKGPQRTVLVSDAVALAGCAPGEYHQHVGGPVAVGADGAIRMAGGGLLAGSSIALQHAVARTVALTGCSLGEAVRMATETPAELLGLRRGRLVAGDAADILLFRWKAGDAALEIVDGIARGETKSVHGTAFHQTGRPNAVR